MTELRYHIKALHGDDGGLWEPRRKLVALNAANIVKAGASSVLALDPGALGRLVALVPAKPVQRREAAGIVTIRGPLAQRAIADMCGYVDGYDAVVARFEAALSDQAIDAVVVDIDSPGGDVAGLEQAVEAMRKAQARSGKPVFVYVNECAASAAYWIAAAVATEGISLPPAAMVGSIGCIGGIVDETKALEQDGIEVTLVRYPEGKAESHPAGPVKPLAEDRLRGRVTAAGKRFVAAMAKARAMSAEQIEGLNGALHEGQQAVREGLADRVEDFESVVARAQRAGRKAASERKAHMFEQQVLAILGFSDHADALRALTELKSFEKSVLSILGVKSSAEAIGAMTAQKETAEQVPVLTGKLAAAEENLQTLRKRQDDNEAEQAIQAARAENKIVPANLEKARAHYGTFGLASLKSYLDGLVPVAPAAMKPEPQVAFGHPAKTASSEPAATAPDAPQKPYEKMAPIERHNFRKAHGEEAYAALKQDWESRGKPRG